jgi:hypothetical protein
MNTLEDAFVNKVMEEDATADNMGVQFSETSDNISQVFSQECIKHSCILTFISLDICFYFKTSQF